ncbi:MAG: alcohol dehydrogenase catalytic domain-containing protein [Gemmataceae bacterium]|nr:alcohol dehydrogenase catalytic domain-containing protein [Gemmataceae bacterium]
MPGHDLSPPGRTHRCAYLVRPGRIEVREVPTPRPGPGEVLLRIERALIGGTDRKAFERGHPQIPMPGPFGHRYSGSVGALGPDAPPFEPGQPIMGVHSAPCLTCDLCRKERWHLCPDVMREKVLGAFAQYLCIPAPVARQNLFPRPAGLSAEHAALLEPLACAVHGLELVDWLRVENVLILGLGVSGLLFAQLLPLYTSARRVGAGRRARRLELGRRFGLDPVWDVSTIPLDEQLNPAERFDVVLECTGRLEGWQQAFDRTAPGGQVLLFGGLPRGTVFPVDSYRQHYEEVHVLGSFHFAPRDVVQARDYLLSGRLELTPLIDACLSLERLPEGLLRLEQGEGIQYALDPWGK